MHKEVAEYDIPLLEPPRSILDIGACRGAFALRCAAKWPGAFIDCFEPVRGNYEALCANTAPESARIACRQFAIRAAEGESDIFLGDNLATASFYQLGRQTSQVERVRCIAAGMLSSVDFVKIDAEGCELEILSRLKLDQTRAIAVEFHSAKDFDAIQQICRTAGFEEISHISHGPESGILKFARPGAVAARKLKLFIGMPVYSQMPVLVTQCLLELQRHKPFPIELQFSQGDGVARSRNQLTAEFLKSDCTHLLFIDCDLIFNSAQISRICSHDDDIVAGYYPKKQEGPLEWVINTFSPAPPPRADDLQEVAYAGTGFLRISRRVIERMVAEYPHLAYAADYGTREIQYDIWQMGVYCYDCHDLASKTCPHPPERRRYLSEDWFFCQRARDMQIKSYMDGRISLGHLGSVIFPLETQRAEITKPKGKAPAA